MSPLIVVTKSLPMYLSPSPPPRATSECRCCLSDVLPITQSNLKSRPASTFLTESPLCFRVRRSITSKLSHILTCLSTCSSPCFSTHGFQMLVSSTSHGVLEKPQQPLFLPPLCLWTSQGQQPPNQGPGATGSAAYHGLSRLPCVWVAAPRKVLEDVDLVPRSHSCRPCKHLQVVTMGMGFSFLAMTSRPGFAQDPQVDVFVLQSQLLMKGFQSLKEGVAVELTFKKSLRAWWGILY